MRQRLGVWDIRRTLRCATIEFDRPETKYATRWSGARLSATHNLFPRIQNAYTVRVTATTTAFELWFRSSPSPFKTGWDVHRRPAKAVVKVFPFWFGANCRPGLRWYDVAVGRSAERTCLHVFPRYCTMRHHCNIIIQRSTRRITSCALPIGGRSSYQQDGE